MTDNPKSDSMDTEQPSALLPDFAKAYQVISELCSGKRKWKMEVPANEDDDPDLILSGVLHEAEKVINALPRTPAPELTGGPTGEGEGWTHALPTKEGFYWWRKSKTSNPKVCDVWSTDGGASCSFTGGSFMHGDVSDFEGEWLGPIAPSPEVPADTVTVSRYKWVQFDRDLEEHIELCTTSTSVESTSSDAAKIYDSFKQLMKGA